jgi:hypothetical protein
MISIICRYVASGGSLYQVFSLIAIKKQKKFLFFPWRHHDLLQDDRKRFIGSPQKHIALNRKAGNAGGTKKILTIRERRRMVPESKNSISGEPHDFS